MAIDERVAPGTTVAGFRIEALIGSGGMGNVYRARDLRLGRAVGLKLLNARLSGDQDFRDRMLRESRLAASLDHPNVIPIYEAGEADDQLFIAMRYVEGTDLRSLLRSEGPLDPVRAVGLAGQVADALDSAHELGLVHRDVKPSNILIDRPGGREHCYLADFGLTQSASDRGPTDGHFMGTVDYVAPEQIRGDDLDGRADQYALACLLFELLTGTAPFARGSEVATLFAHLSEPAPSAATRRRHVSEDVDRVLARALAKEPAERFPSCREFVEAAAATLGVIAKSPRRYVWIAAAAALAVAAALAAVVLSRGSAAPRGPEGALVRIDAESGRVEGRLEVKGHPDSVAATRGGVWIADMRGGALWRYRPRTDALEKLVTSGEPRDVAAAGPYVYVAVDGPKIFSGTVTRYDAESGIREDGVTLLACALAAGEGVLWAAGCPEVDRLSTDSRPLRILRRVPLPFATPLTSANNRIQFRELAVGGGALWVLGDARDRRLWRLDARSGAILATIRLSFPPRSLAYAAGSVWVTDPLNDNVVPVDVRSNSLGAPIRVGRGVSGVAANDRGVWVALAFSGAVARIDPRSRRVVDRVDVGGSPREIDISGGVVWVTSHDA